MLLADTSVWIERFRRREPTLAGRLSERIVLTHPFVAGELACGNLKDRAAILSDLHALPPANVASDASCRLWTLDLRLAKAAVELGLG